MRAEKLLYDATIEALSSSLGKETMKALLYELNEHEVPLTPKHVDVKTLETELQALFGDGASILIERIYIAFAAKAKCLGLLSGEHADDEVDGKDVSTLDSMRKIIEMQAG